LPPSAMRCVLCARYGAKRDPAWTAFKDQLICQRRRPV
jgi:hypothetical protein